MIVYPEGLTYTEQEARQLVHSGEARYDQVEPVQMPGGETWYRVVA